MLSSNSSTSKSPEMTSSRFSGLSCDVISSFTCSTVNVSTISGCSSFQRHADSSSNICSKKLWLTRRSTLFPSALLPTATRCLKRSSARSSKSGDSRRSRTSEKARRRAPGADVAMSMSRVRPSPPHDASWLISNIVRNLEMTEGACPPHPPLSHAADPAIAAPCISLVSSERPPVAVRCIETSFGRLLLRLCVNRRPLLNRPCVTVVASSVERSVTVGFSVARRAASSPWEISSAGTEMSSGGATSLMPSAIILLSSSSEKSAIASSPAGMLTNATDGESASRKPVIPWKRRAARALISSCSSSSRSLLIVAALASGSII
mmetsp:Transcript_30568/g.75009  ORF Transcript_30568/g.75009 Transcript_30568/m.75009 type:complete len:321 (-) Transcript_30568:928-1890(-)